MCTPNYEEYKTMLLHENPQYLEECCSMLNSQWKRSRTARLHSLCKSSGNFPCSLLLVELKDGKETLLGHCRICRVAHCKKSCWIESFLIVPVRRGQGLGRRFLNLVEEFARNSGFCTVYLMTEDKEEFYKHLGYQRCSPVSAIFLSGLSALFTFINIFPWLVHTANHFFSFFKFLRISGTWQPPPSFHFKHALEAVTSSEISVNKKDTLVRKMEIPSTEHQITSQCPPPPPPLPLPCKTISTGLQNIRGNSCCWMMKNI